MNIALGALFLFLLIAPGIVFRVSFLKSDSLKSVVDTTIISELLFVLLPAYLFQVVGIFFMEKVVGKDVDIEQVYLLLTGSKDAELLDFALLESSLPIFLLYTLVLVGIGGWLGRRLQKLVFKYGWDRRFAFLKISNDWEKLFNGRYLNRSERDRLEFVRVDLSTSVGKEDFLYCGILEKFTLDKEQGLDKVVLSSVFRRKFSDDLEKRGDNNVMFPGPDAPSSDRPVFDDRYYPMPGYYFIIPFSAINNINVSYYILEEESNTNVESPKSIPIPDK